jgi:hypothetical protein
MQAEAANAELLELLADFLPRRFPDRFTKDGSALINHATGDVWDLSDPSLDPLEVSSLLVQVRALGRPPSVRHEHAILYELEMAAEMGSAAFFVSLRWSGRAIPLIRPEMVRGDNATFSQLGATFP